VLSESFDRMAQASEELKGRSAGGVLTLSVSPNFAARWLAPRLGSFATAHPEIDLRITATSSRVDFAREGVDLAVRHGDGRWPDLFVDRLAEEQLFPVASPHLLASEALRLDRLRPQLLIRSLGRDDWPLWLAAAGRPELRPEGPAFDQDFMAIDAAVAGQGLAMARSLLVARDLLAGRLVRPFALRLPAPFAYWIAAPPAFARRPKVRAFRSWLKTEAAAELARLSEAAP
jgi:LysR family glycine cleavage system transcriptional activator